MLATAPGARLSATIAAFSAALQRRRRGAPVRTSTRRKLCPSIGKLLGKPASLPRLNKAGSSVRPQLPQDGGSVSLTIACAESWEDIELYGRSKQAWLKTFLSLPNGIPSHDTFRRVFMLIDPDAFEGCFVRRAQSLRGKVEREVVRWRCDSGRGTERDFGRDLAALGGGDW